MSVFNVWLWSRHAALQWYRVWTLPVYAGMYLVHSRYRALRPRRLPTLTSLRLPEIYGLLALGDIAGYEAEHLRDDELDGNRRSIEACSELLHMLFHERRYEVEAGYPDLTRSKYSCPRLSAVRRPLYVAVNAADQRSSADILQMRYHEGRTAQFRSRARSSGECARGGRTSTTERSSAIGWRISSPRVG